MREVDWPVLLGIFGLILGILVAPYNLLMLVQRIWERRRSERIARGEDVQPRKLPWDVD